jgi:lipopolysaccharide export system protein LptA
MAGIIGAWAAALVFMIPMASAGEKSGPETELIPEKPLHVTADKMKAHQDESMVEFIGNVRADQDNTVLLADSIKIFLHPTQPDSPEKGNAGRIKQIVAATNVEYTAGDRKAFADKAVYTAEEDILVLTGKEARLLTGTSWVSGTKITLFRKQDRVLVESDGKTRVQALFNPEDNPVE